MLCGIARSVLTCRWRRQKLRRNCLFNCQLGMTSWMSGLLCCCGGEMKAKSRRRWKQAALLACLLALTACESVQTTQGGVVGVGRQQRMAVSAEQVDQSARQEYVQVLVEERKKGNLN